MKKGNALIEILLGLLLVSLLAVLILETSISDYSFISIYSEISEVCDYICVLEKAIP
jgi:hypothetical protein